MIRRITFADADLAHQIAELHCREISGGVLGILGPRFLGQLYRYIAVAPGSAVWADFEEVSLRGFICGCRDDKRMFAFVIARGWPRLVLAGLLSLGGRGVVAGVLSTIRVLIGPTANDDQPRAQLLSIAVSQDYRRHGVASGLVTVLHEQFAGWHVDRALVWTTKSNLPALTLYERSGYERRYEVRHSPENMVGLVRTLANSQN